MLNKPVSQKTTRLLFIISFMILFGLYGYLFTSRRPLAQTAAIIPGRAGVPTFDFMIYGGFGEMQLNKPLAVTTANGRIYVSDSDNARIQVFDNAGNFLFAFGERGRDAGQMQYPYGIAADRDGNIYVSELRLGRVYVFDADGEFLREFAQEARLAQQIASPGDIAIEGNTLYLTEITKNYIMIFNLETEKITKLVGMKGDLLAPNGIAVDEAGYMYVVDTGRQRVVVYNPDGNPVRLINGTPTGHGMSSVLINPRGIGVDRAGNVYVVSNLSHTIYVFNREGQVTHQFGGQGDGNTEFMFPNGLHVDPAGRILITDTTLNRVAVYRIAR
ncbi:MAG: 6-bladed beta-propeller [Clostridiales bacterium]|nr:6-bladed beta-propeller [Clostridiales bacterium]